MNRSIQEGMDTYMKGKSHKLTKERGLLRGLFTMNAFNFGNTSLDHQLTTNK